MRVHQCLIGVCLILVVAFGRTVHAQGVQTGELTGRVVSPDGLSLPGATVTVESPAMQGSRLAVTDLAGVYVMRALPPGTYAVRFEFAGASSREETVMVPLGGRAELDTTLEPAGVEMTVTVVAATPTVLTTPQIGTNTTADETNALATGRTLQRIAERSPGLTNNTPNSRQVSISGAFAYDNVFMVDGVDVNDNLLADPDALFIEDAIEETQVLTSGISAEYGRFSGGVINAITKSGGNDLSGSFRTTFTNPAWSSETPFERNAGIDRESDLSKYFEGTLGGPVKQNRLWFFFATRNERSSESGTFPETGIPFTSKTQNDRYEVKLTGTPLQNHTVRGSYLDNGTDLHQATFPFTIDPAGIISPSLPNRLYVVSWDGVLSSSLFASVKVSRKEYGVRGLGGTSTDIVDSPFLTLTQSFAHYNAPYFDTTDPEDRDNQQVSGSLSYFASSPDMGTHDVKAGGEYFVSTLGGGNSQSATGYVFDADYATDPTGAPLLDTGGRLIPVFSPFGTLLENWIPMRGAKLDIKTTSLYMQDHWAAGDHWSFDLGMRYENVRSAAPGAISGLDTNTVVPRLAAAYDVRGDGQYILRSTYGHYAGRYSEAQFANNTNVGNPDALFGVYTGPAGQGRDFAPGFDVNNYLTVDGLFPSANVFFADGLSSPLTREFTLSGGMAIGRDGHAMATYVRRSMSNFIEDFITLEDGTTTVVQNGVEFGTFQNQVYRNSDVPHRDYQALLLQARQRLSSRWTVDGHWTVQLENDGNFEGEARSQPGISSPFGNYPEVFSEARHYPTGRLAGFQRHKVRLWSIYDMDMGHWGDLGMGALWRSKSARAYSLAATRVRLTDVQKEIGQSLGYANLPSSQTLFFGDRGSQSFDGYGLLDLSLDYAMPIKGRVEPWLKAEFFNVLNNDTLMAWNTSVVPDPESPLDALGLPTGYLEGSTFGQGTSNAHYPFPLPDETGGRTFRLSLGFRF